MLQHASTPLQISSQTFPNDIKLTMHMAPNAPLGHIDLDLGLGSGSKGRGTRIANNAALHVVLVRRAAAHLVAYANGFELEAAADLGEAWDDQLAAVQLSGPLAH